MYRIALLLDKRVQHIGLYETLPQFASPLVAIDITEYNGDVREGYLYDAENGSFYYKPTVEPIEPELVEPDPQPTETIDGKLARMEQQLQEQQLQNLILVDINLTVYEEVLTLKDQLSQLTGATDNA